MILSIIGLHVRRCQERKRRSGDGNRNGVTEMGTILEWMAIFIFQGIWTSIVIVFNERIFRSRVEKLFDKMESELNGRKEKYKSS